MVSLALWDVSIQERQGLRCVGRSGSDVAGVSGGGGRGGNGFGRVIRGESRCEVRRKDGSLRWSESEELFLQNQRVYRQAKKRHEVANECCRWGTGDDTGRGTFGTGSKTSRSLRYRFWTKSTSDKAVKLSIHRVWTNSRDGQTFSEDGGGLEGPRGPGNTPCPHG